MTKTTREDDNGREATVDEVPMRIPFITGPVQMMSAGPELKNRYLTKVTRVLFHHWLSP